VGVRQPRSQQLVFNLPVIAFDFAVAGLDLLWLGWIPVVDSPARRHWPIAAFDWLWSSVSSQFPSSSSSPCMNQPISPWGGERCRHLVLCRR